MLMTTSPDERSDQLLDAAAERLAEILVTQWEQAKRGATKKGRPRQGKNQAGRPTSTR